jgi:hypothetical protein
LNLSVSALTKDLFIRTIIYRTPVRDFVFPVGIFQMSIRVSAGARYALYLLFLIPGLTMATWVTRTPGFSVPASWSPASAAIASPWSACSPCP